MFAGPDGARVAEKQAVLAGLRKAMELLKTVGHTSTKLASLNETRVDEHYAMVALSSCGALTRRQHHRSMSRSIPRSSCISRTVRPRLSFNMSTRISGRRCERAVCCRRRDDSVARALNTCPRSRGSSASLRSERGITSVAPGGRWRDHERPLVNANALAGPRIWQDDAQQRANRPLKSTAAMSPVVDSPCAEDRQSLEGAACNPRRNRTRPYLTPARVGARATNVALAGLRRLPLFRCTSRARSFPRVGVVARVEIHPALPVRSKMSLLQGLSAEETG